MSNLLNHMRHSGKIINVGARKAPNWVWMDKTQDKNLSGCEENPAIPGGDVELRMSEAVL